MCMSDEMDEVRSTAERGWRGAWSPLRRCWADPAEMARRARRWLFAEEEEELSDQASAPSVAGLVCAGMAGLVEGGLQLAGVAALLLVLYYNVPAVRSFAGRIDHHLAAGASGDRDSHFVRLHDAAPRLGDRALIGCPSEAKAPSPPPLAAALPVSNDAPLIAVTGQHRVSLYSAAGKRLWSRAGTQAIFSPAGQAALIDHGPAGWVAVDGLTGKRLAWSSALQWVPACAQIKWSPSGQLILFEWPLEDDSGRLAVGLFSAAQGRWIAQLADDEPIACALLSAWSPDETRVAVPSAAGAMLLDASSGEVTRAAFANRQEVALWYPGGDRLLGGEGRRGSSCIGLRTYNLRSATSDITPVEAAGSRLRPIAWLDNGRALVCQSAPDDDDSAGECSILDWPSGELLTALGSTCCPRVDAARQWVASYCLDENGSVGTLRAVSLCGAIRTLDPRPMVGIPLKWIAGDADEDSDEPARAGNWLFDFQWQPSAGDGARGGQHEPPITFAAANQASAAPRGPSAGPSSGANLYLLARRGVDSWCLWRWSPASGALRPVGKAVRWRSDSGRSGLPRFELVFVRRKAGSRPKAAPSHHASPADRGFLPRRPEPAPTRPIPSLQASRPAAYAQARP
jgi:hypothetical protein